MRVVVIADTHGDLRKMQVPDGDLLLHCGDLDAEVPRQLIRFDEELGQLPHKYKIVIAGNHDFLFEREPEKARALLTQATYLQDEQIVVEGIKIYGTPWVPAYLGYAFNLPRDGEELACIWANIPRDTDILMTHCPPREILDQDYADPLGCDVLRFFLEAGQFTPALHCFGHIHGGYGQQRVGKTLFVNAAYGGCRTHEAVVLDWDELKARHAAEAPTT